MKILLSIILLIYASALPAQLKNAYIIQYSEKDFNSPFKIENKRGELHTCDIIFNLEKKEYEIFLYIAPSNPYSDQNFIDLISYGKYKINNNTVILFDVMHNYNMHAKIGTRDITFIKSFPFFTGKVFTETEFDDTIYGDSLHLPDIESNIYHTIPKTASNVKELELKYGKYVDAGGQYLLDLNTNHYNLYFNNILLSSGSWKRIINELILTDKSMGDINIRISNKGLICDLLPFEFDTVILKKEYFK